MICLFFGRDFGIEAPIARTDLNAYAVEEFESGNDVGWSKHAMGQRKTKQTSEPKSCVKMLLARGTRVQEDYIEHLHDLHPSPAFAVRSVIHHISMALEIPTHASSTEHGIDTYKNLSASEAILTTTQARNRWPTLS